MTTVPPPDFSENPILGTTHGHPCHCDLPAMIQCWSRYVREVRTDLESARGHPDEEVLVSDLRDAEAQLARLLDLAIARAEARAA